MTLNNRQDMELHFIYNSNMLQEREAFGYITSLANHSVRDTDVYKNGMTERMLADLASKLDVKLNELFDTTHEKYQSEIANADFEDNDILKMISEDMSLLRTPILESNDSAEFVKGPYQTIQVDMAVKSISEQMSNKDEK